jgi:CheY-like chemotaxis protein
MEGMIMGAQILIVDDDREYLLATKLLLQAEHYDVVTAGGTTEATKQLRKSRPDLILLDVKMPEKDGFTFCDELAADPEFADIPIVLVTVVAENVGVVMAAFEKDYALDAKDIVPKTAVQKDLVEVVRRCLAEKA